jgi:hypothetical protein
MSDSTRERSASSGEVDEGGKAVLSFVCEAEVARDCRKLRSVGD